MQQEKWGHFITLIRILEHRGIILMDTLLKIVFRGSIAEEYIVLMVMEFRDFLEQMAE